MNRRLFSLSFFFYTKKVAPPRLYEGGHPKNQLLKDIYFLKRCFTGIPFLILFRARVWAVSNSVFSSIIKPQCLPAKSIAAVVPFFATVEREHQGQFM